MDERDGAEREPNAERDRQSSDDRPVPDLTSPAVTRSQDAEPSGYDSSENIGSSSNS